MKLTIPVPLCVLVVLLVAGQARRVEAAWSLPHLWPSKEKSAGHTGHQHSPQRPRHAGAKASSSSHWLPSMSTLAAAPKNLWYTTTRVFRPKSSARPATSETVRSSRKHWTMGHFGSRKKNKKKGSQTIADFLSKKRPAF